MLDRLFYAPISYLMTTSKLNPPFVSHPGKYIKMELEGRGIKQKDFADVLGITKVEVNHLIHGKRNITPRLAARIGEAFGT